MADKETKKKAPQTPAVKFNGEDWTLVDVAGQTLAIERDGVRLAVHITAVEPNKAAKVLMGSDEPEPVQE